MKLISWNVNGLRACIQKGFLDFFNRENADFFCLQETKLQEGQIQLDLPGYEQYWCYARKKGYSGTAIFTKHTPMSVSYGLGVEDLDTEGRMITLEYREFYLVTCYTPNAQRGLARLDHRMRWDEAFRQYVSKLDAKKPVILCGDLNVAHKEIDLKNPGANRFNAGFSDEERESFTKTMELGLTDTFRHLHPDEIGRYTWWSYMFHARENNAGWRIDYFLASDRIAERVFKAPIYADILGSDHCPVGLEIDLSCNGSVWISDSQGDATVVPKEPPQIPVTKKNVKMLSLLLLCAFLAGILVGRFLPSQATLSDPSFPQATEAPNNIPVNFEELPSGADPVIVTPLDETLKLIDNYRGDCYVHTSETRPLYLKSADFTTLKERLSSCNYYTIINLTDDGRLFISENPAVSLTKQGLIPLSVDIQIMQFYTAAECQSLGGWILYGTLPCPANITLCLSDSGLFSNNYKVYTGIQYPIGYRSYEEVAHLSTSALINRAVQIDAISQYCKADLSFAEASLRYQQLEQSFPVLQALKEQNDILNRLKNFASRPQLNETQLQNLQIIINHIQPTV